MKVGRSQENLVQEILRQAETKKDYIADTRKISLVAKDSDVRMVIDDQLEIGIKELAHRQIGEHVKIPAVYYDKMRTEDPDLLATNINRWFKKYPAKQMIRT